MACGGRTVVVTPRESGIAGCHSHSCVSIRAIRLAICSGASAAGSHAPPPDADYKLKAKDATGFSVSYDVIGPDGVEWSAKIGPEAQTEVVLSRILWGLGYHQPPIYYLPSWRLDDGNGHADGGKRGAVPAEASRIWCAPKKCGAGRTTRSAALAN